MAISAVEAMNILRIKVGEAFSITKKSKHANQQSLQMTWKEKKI